MKKPTPETDAMIVLASQVADLGMLVVDAESAKEMERDRNAERTVKNSVIKNYDIALAQVKSLKAKKDSLFRAWQQVMERMGDRSLYYGHTSDQAKGGPKQYTKSQLEAAKAKAMHEARLIVLMFMDVDDAPASESDCVAAETADEKPDGQAENA